jgi:hypothetical protein
MSVLRNQIKSQGVLDTLGGLLSVGCAIHCLLVPVITVVWPMLGATFLADHSFHTLLLYFVIPTALISLTLGCRNHGNYHVLVWGGMGLGLLTFLTLTEEHSCVGCAASHPHSTLAFWTWPTDVMIQKGGMILASLLLCWAHFKNYRACKSSNCSSHSCH